MLGVSWNPVNFLDTFSILMAFRASLEVFNGSFLRPSTGCFALLLMNLGSNLNSRANNMFTMFSKLFLMLQQSALASSEGKGATATGRDGHLLPSCEHWSSCTSCLVLVRLLSLCCNLVNCLRWCAIWPSLRVCKL